MVATASFGIMENQRRCRHVEYVGEEIPEMDVRRVEILREGRGQCGGIRSGRGVRGGGGGGGGGAIDDWVEAPQRLGDGASTWPHATFEIRVIDILRPHGTFSAEEIVTVLTSAIGR